MIWKLKAVIDLEEDTSVTRSVLSCAQKLLAIDERGTVHLQQLMTKMRQIYSGMFQSLQHCIFNATRKEKLWVMFHCFSIKEGFEMCNTCDKALNLTAPELLAVVDGERNDDVPTANLIHLLPTSLIHPLHAVSVMRIPHDGGIPNPSLHYSVERSFSDTHELFTDQSSCVMYYGHTLKTGTLQMQNHTNKLYNY